MKENLTDLQKKFLEFNSTLPIDPSILRENVDDLKTTISTLCKQYAGVQEELVNLSAQYDKQEKLLEIAVEALEFYKNGVHKDIKFTAEEAFGAGDVWDLWYDKSNCYRVGRKATEALAKIRGQG